MSAYFRHNREPLNINLHRLKQYLYQTYMFVFLYGSENSFIPSFYCSKTEWSSIFNKLEYTYDMDISRNLDFDKQNEGQQTFVSWYSS